MSDITGSWELVGAASFGICADVPGAEAYPLVFADVRCECRLQTSISTQCYIHFFSNVCQMLPFFSPNHLDQRSHW
jgi:hypothetical protein